MNTKGMKFLAVLAVLAMAFAVFAVVSDSQGNDAEPIVIKLDDNVSITTTAFEDAIVTADGLDYTIVGSFEGTATHTGAYTEAEYAYYAMATVTFTATEGGTLPANIYVKQTNSALGLAEAVFTPKTSSETPIGTIYKNGNVYGKVSGPMNSSDWTFSFLIPQDGSTVTFEVYGTAAAIDPATKSEAMNVDDLIAIMTIDFSNAYTVIGLDAANASSPGWSYVADGKKLTLSASTYSNAMFNGTGIGAASTSVSDGMMAAHGLVVKKVSTTTTYFTTVGDAVKSIDVATDGKATPALASASTINVTLLDDTEELTGITMTHGSDYYDSLDHYVALNLNLNGKTIKHTSATGLVGTSSVNKMFDFEANQIVKIYNGTITSQLTYLDKDTKDVGFAVIGTNGPLTLGDGATGLVIDISEVKMAAATGEVSQHNYAVGVWAASGITTMKSDVVIYAGDHFSAIASYATTDKVVDGVHVQSINAGTGVAGAAEAMSRVVVDGAKLYGSFGTVHWKTGAAATTTEYTYGAEFFVESGTLDGKVLSEARWVNGGNTSETTQEGITYSFLKFNGGTFTDYSALQFVAEGKSITIDAGGKDVPAEEPTVVPVEGGTVTIDVEELKADEANAIVIGSDAAVTSLAANVGTNDVVIIGKGQALTGVDLTVTGKGAVALSGFASVSGTITTGTGSSAQTIRLSEAVGTFTFSEGSIIVETEWTSGTIYLKNGDVLKLSGNITGEANILRDPTDTTSADKYSATVVIEAGGDKMLTIADGATLTIGDAGDYTNKIAVLINGAVIANGEDGTGALDLSKAKSLTIKDGGVLAANVTSAKTNTIYSGGDINEMTMVVPGGSTIAAQWEKWTGKDAASGTWTYKDNTLTLNGYNGTYNMAGIPDAITDIELNGDSVISVELPIIRASLFGGANLEKITTDGYGTLEIDVDISDVEGEDLDVLPAVIMGDADGTLKINGVSIVIEVTGSNVTWTDDETEAMAMVGIDAYNLDLFEVPLGISIMPAYDSRDIIGIDAEGTFDITGKTVLISATTAIKADDTSVKTATVGTKGAMVLVDTANPEDPVLKPIEISNKSIVAIDGMFVVGGIKVSQESELEIKDAIIGGNLENKGVVKSIGNVMVLDTGTITNYASMDNSGVLGIYGDFVNADGTFTNDGVVNVYAMKNKAATAEIVINDETAPSANNAKLKSIAFDNIREQYDGTMTFDAIVTVYKTLGSAVVVDAFEGVITPAFDGSYSLTMASGTATITITHVEAETPDDHVGKDYTITVTGTVKVGEDNLYLQANTVSSTFTAEVTGDTVKVDGSYEASGADFDVNKGYLVNNGTIIVSSSNDGKLVASAASYNGSLVSNVNITTIAGTFDGNLLANGTGLVTVSKFNGNIVSKGSVKVSEDKGMTGNIVAKQGVTIDGALVGDISTEGNVVINEMIGHVTVVRENDDVAAKTVTVNGAALIDVTYKSKYKATKDATETTEYTAVMEIVGTANGLIIDLAKGENATDTKEVVPGYFRIIGTDVLGDNKTVDMVLKEGRILVDTVTTLEARYYLTIEAGATIEVNKSAASLDVKKGALKVSKDANALFEVGSELPVNYGKVYFVMAFQIDDGAYTIYSDVAYALLNCEEGTELIVGESAEINQDVTVKAGVNIVVEDITLTFNGKNVEMSEGAMITIEGTGKVIFKETGDNKADTKKGDAITYYSVSGTIVYEDNAVVFDEVRFTADSTIQGVAATSTAVDKIKTDLAFDEGIAKLASGTGTGTITLNNDVNDVTNDDEPETVMVFATFVVGADTVFDAVAINDSAAKVLYNDEDDPEVKEYTLLATIVGAEGTLNLSADTTINGAYIGTGKVVIADGKKVTLASGEDPEPGVKKFVPGSLNTYFVDSTEDANGYLFNLTTTDAGTDTPLALTAGTITVSGEKVNVMKIEGCLYVGIVKATTAACLDDLYVHENAAIYGAVVYVIDDSTADGYVGAGLIFMDETPFKALDYEVTFEEDGYTIYTQFEAVEWTDATDITIVKGEIEIDKKLDLSGKDVNIVIGEKATFTLKSILIIGTPATVIGDEGSSIVGKITIIDDAKAYLVAYADVDLTEADIVGQDPKIDAVFSKLDIEDVVYATIFASNQDADPLTHVILAKADAAIIPAIVGYNFTSWLNYNGDAKAEVGETNAYADAKAVYLTITVKYVAGVDYYMNGSLFNVYDIPTDVPYGSYFTAKISDTTKYQGNPVINGEKTVCVIDDMELVASGVTPIPAPTPEPVEENTGLSLTDILLIVLVILIAIMVVILVLRLNRS